MKKLAYKKVIIVGAVLVLAVIFASFALKPQDVPDTDEIASAQDEEELDEENLTMHLDIDTSNLQYVEVFTGNVHVYTLDYEEHKEALDSFFSMLAGDYSYEFTHDTSNIDGGGPCFVKLYDDEGNELQEILYARKSGSICVEIGDLKYKYYSHKEHTLDFSEFEDYGLQHIKR